MDYNYNFFPTTPVSFEKQQYFYRFMLLLVGSLLTLTLLFNLLKTNNDGIIAEPTQIFSELFNSAQEILFNSSNTLDEDQPEYPFLISQTNTSPITNENLPFQPLYQNSVKSSALAQKLTVRDILIKNHESLTIILKSLNFNEHTTDALLALPQAYPLLTQLQSGKHVIIKVNAKSQLETLEYKFAPTQTLTIIRNGNGYSSQIKSGETIEELGFSTLTIKNSLYQTAKNAGLSADLISQLTNIFDNNVNLKAIRKGDQLSILYQKIYKHGKVQRTANIIGVIFKYHGKTYSAIRQPGDNRSQNFYSPTGEGVKISFLRVPLHYSRISSPFSLSRNHPILHIRRPHYGVDLAAPAGTPIKASGNGRIIFAGRRGGFGNVIIIRHDHRYTTLYGHMKKFAKKLKKGDYVNEGQIIGYVGMTGLATGPHVHYEFHVNGKPVNPITVALPKTNSIPHRELQSFEKYARCVLTRMSYLNHS